MRVAVPSALCDEFRTIGPDAVAAAFHESYQAAQSGKTDDEIKDIVIGTGRSEPFAKWVVSQSIASQGNPLFDLEDQRRKGTTKPYAWPLFLFSVFVLLFFVAMAFTLNGMERGSLTLVAVCLAAGSFIFVVWAGLQVTRNRKL